MMCIVYLPSFSRTIHQSHHPHASWVNLVTGTTNRVLRSTDLEGYFDVISSLISFSADFGKFRESPKSSFNFEHVCISPTNDQTKWRFKHSLLIAPDCLIDLQHVFHWLQLRNRYINDNTRVLYCYLTMPTLSDRQLAADALHWAFLVDFLARIEAEQLEQY